MSIKSEREQERLESLSVPKPIATVLDATFNKVWSMYWNKDGIHELAVKLAEKQKPFREAMEAGLFQAMQLCWENSGKVHEKALELFKAACAQLEFRAKIRYRKAMGDDNATQNMQVIMPGWVLAKTAAAKFFEQRRDLDATETVEGKETPRFDSLSKVRTVVAQRGARPEGNQPAPGSDNSSISVAVLASAKLKAVMRTMAATLVRMNQTYQDQAADLLEQATAKLVEMLQAQHDAEREARKGAQAELDQGIRGEKIGTDAEEAPQGADVVPMTGQALPEAARNRESARRGGSRR